MAECYALNGSAPLSAPPRGDEGWVEAGVGGWTGCWLGGWVGGGWGGEAAVGR